MSVVLAIGFVVAGVVTLALALRIRSETTLFLSVVLYAGMVATLAAQALPLVLPALGLGIAAGLIGLAQHLTRIASEPVTNVR